MSAPRRIGKTSFLKNICKQEEAGYLVRYLIIESADNANDFFKHLYRNLLEHFSKMGRIWESMADFLKDGIELKGVDLDYFEEFKRLINRIEPEEILVFIIDEFSEVTENIINAGGKDAARQFLHQNRELRHEETIKKKIRFVYSGSIGLGNLAESIDATKTINDLSDFPFPVLKEEEAISMIDQLTIHPDVKFNREVKKHLIESIHWLMPYYIQVILSEAETIMTESGNPTFVTREIIDRAISEALSKRTYFEHWYTRLNTAFREKDRDFALNVLNQAAGSERGVSKTSVFDLALKHDIKNERMHRILRTLEYDGYLSFNEDRIYHFNSTLLKKWWERNILV